MSKSDAGHGPTASGRAGESLLHPLRPALNLTAGFWLVALSAILSFRAHAFAQCLELPYPDVRALEALSARDPHQALEATRRALIAAHPADGQTPAIPTDSRRLAALYEVRAQSYSLLELDAEARSAASDGLKLVPDPGDPVHVLLQTTQAENVYDPQGIDKAIGEIQQARAAQPPRSRPDVCLQIALGRLQYRSGRINSALVTLTQAYRAAISQSAPGARVEAAAALSPVMRVEGDFQQALALNQEVIDWQDRHEETLSLSVSRYLRGQIFVEMRDYEAAIVQTLKARQLSVDLKDEQGVGFADLAICDARLEQGALSAARESCENALRIFSASHSIDVVRQSQTQLARLDLAEGHPGKALAALDGILANKGADIQPRQLPLVYQIRAESNAALHKYADAYADLREYLKLHIAAVDDDRSKQVAALRARFETDREIARNETLQRELELAQERSQRQRAQMRWVVAAISASGLLIALLTFLLVSNLRYRKQLVRMASIDSLTGLSNRGSMAAVAASALEDAGRTRQPLSLALIDLDRFKMLNDQFGHATGDRVLKEFAKIATACLRPGDTVGRWGGEEFLALFPNTTLDAAMQFLDDLRLRLAQINLPDASVRVSISAGLATTGEEGISLDEILARADVALYRAKNSGRNLVCYAQESFEAASTAVRRALRQR